MDIRRLFFSFFLCFLLSCVYAEDLLKPISLNGFALSSEEEMNEISPTEENISWQDKISPYVRFDEKSNTFFYQEGKEESFIINNLENNENYRQAVYLGALSNQSYLFRQESWQGWRIIAISPTLNKRAAFNLAEAFVSSDEKTLLIMNIPLEGCEKKHSLSCPFKLTEYSIDNHQGLTPIWQGQINLPHSSFVVDPLWGQNSQLWLRVIGANEELYYLKMVKD